MKNENNNAKVKEEDNIFYQQKLNISNSIKEQIKKRHISVRDLAVKVNLKHPQIIRVTNGENYNIDTLTKILDGLDLELVVQKKNN